MRQLFRGRPGKDLDGLVSSRSASLGCEFAILVGDVPDRADLTADRNGYGDRARGRMRLRQPRWIVMGVPSSRVMVMDPVSTAKLGLMTINGVELR